MIGAELEQLLRRLIREELDRALNHESPDDLDRDEQLRQRALKRAAEMMKARRSNAG